MHGFWSTYEINFLEYANLGNLIEQSLYIITVSSIVTIIAGFFASYILKPEELQPSLKNGSKSLQDRLNRLEYYIVVYGGVIMMSIWSFNSFYENLPSRWTTFIVLIGMFFIPKVLEASEGYKLLFFINDFKLRHTVTIMLWVILSGSYGYGVSQAQSHRDQTVSVVINDKEAEEYRYIGMLGEHYFLQGPANEQELNIVRSSQISLISFEFDQKNKFREFIDSVIGNYFKNQND